MIEFEGGQVPADRVEVVEATEPFSLYKLADGNGLRIRLVVVDIFKLADRTAPDGTPIYQAQFQIVTTALTPPTAPEEPKT
jgi:hypothetical protein